ncbi:zincin-like metallopeptidase domain-containing protein [Bacteroides graminisolvens]|uniref:zincin-like metallopeptidase domain-containing protein n=1 Tax=Bacteroides graminisolvens TaxID=477666 RepID=UPI0029C636A9|nr:ArdC-like ssDNA-binding domain-containing protein [Bacteroides graminisolvens]
MKQKNKQEQNAANRQVELLTNALNGAAVSGGYWLNASSRSLPRIYPKGPAVSPFNSLVLSMHADQNGYKTNLYTLFADAKKRGEAIHEHETGAPFFWYRWKEYVNRHNPEDTISREDYLKLPNEEKALYKGIRNREVQTMFNIDQTTLPYTDKDKYEQSVERYGRYEDRKHTQNEEGKLRIEVNDFALRMRDNLVPIRKSVTGIVHYDSEKNAMYIPEKKHFGQYNDYVQELMRQVVTATGHQQRLAREGMVMKGGIVPSEDAMKYEQLVAEVASGVKMMELELPSKLSNDSLPLVEYWTRELKENPCLIDAIEADVNNAVDIIRRAEEGEKIEFATFRNKQQTTEMKEKQKPQVDSRESAILQDVIRHGGMKIDERNFPSPEVKTAFLEKFSLSHYEKEKNYALEQTRHEDPEVVETAFTEAVDNGAKIAEICTEIIPEQWNTKGSYFIADELKKLPDRSTKEMVVVKDNISGIVDVVIPAGAMGGGVVAMPNGEKRPYRLTPDEVMTADERVAAHAEVRNYNIPGFSKQRIQDALLQEGYRYIRFYNNNGILGYRPDDSYFEGKDVSLNKLNGKSLEAVSHFDVSEHVQKANVLFDRIQMLRDDNNRWILYLKPQNEPSFSVYPDKADINQFFSTIKQGQYEQGERLRTELAQKYHALATNYPELKIDLFGGGKDNEADLSKIQRVVIYKTKDERILCAPVIDGIPKVEPREITPQQWQRMWVAEDMAEYKTNLAAKVFNDLLKPIQVLEMEEKSALPQINLKQYGEIKTKHPDAILLFRNGDSYESYAEDADKISKLLKFDKAIGIESGSKNQVDIVSFPSYNLDTVLPELIRAGNRVAICDKVEHKEIIDNEQQEEVRTGRRL